MGLRKQVLWRQEAALASTRRFALLFLVPVVAWMSALVVHVNAQAHEQHDGGSGFNVPSTASTEKNPLTVNDAVLASGKKLFASKCQHCHGPQGKGDGPDADPKHADDMDLSESHDAEGVMFYKAWNGRSNPKMPAMSEDLTKNQVWAIIAYVRTLHGK
jgi:mono/diheme cytochrome c family protein